MCPPRLQRSLGEVEAFRTLHLAFPDTFLPFFFFFFCRPGRRHRKLERGPDDPDSGLEAEEAAADGNDAEQQLEAAARDAEQQ